MVQYIQCEMCVWETVRRESQKKIMDKYFDIMNESQLNLQCHCWLVTSVCLNLGKSSIPKQAIVVSERAGAEI